MEPMQAHSCRHLAGDPWIAGGRIPLDARSDELRTGAQDRGTPPHARYIAGVVTTGIIRLCPRVPDRSRPTQAVRTVAADLASRRTGTRMSKRLFWNLASPDLDEAADLLVD